MQKELDDALLTAGGRPIPSWHSTLVTPLIIQALSRCVLEVHCIFQIRAMARMQMEGFWPSPAMLVELAGVDEVLEDRSRGVVLNPWEGRWLTFHSSWTLSISSCIMASRFVNHWIKKV